MNDNKKYEKFVKYLLKEYFTIDEIRSLIENSYVANVIRGEADKKYKNYIKYTIMLVNDDVYYVYAKS